MVWNSLYYPVDQIYCDIVRICRNYIRIDIRSENILVGL
jgi:hypothetical protein